MSTQQWLRQLSLIAGSGDKAIELSALHVTFRISAMTVSSPALLTARVYNLSKQTAKFLSQLPAAPFGQVNREPQSQSTQAVLQGAGFGPPASRVVMQAGYAGNFATVFSGELAQVKLGRDTPADTWVELIAGDGIGGTALAPVNTTLAAGHTQADVNKAIGQAYAPYSVTTGDLPSSVDQAPAPRGKVMFGLAQDHQILFSRSNNMTGYTQQGIVRYWKPTSPYQADQAIVVTSRTGMIGLPTQTDFGVVVRVLLNPSITIGRTIQINNASIQRQTFATDLGTTDANTSLDALNKYADSSADGHYYVFATEIVGDTRGTEWYTDCLCVAADVTVGGALLPTVPQQYVSNLQRVIPGNQ